MVQSLNPAIESLAPYSSKTIARQVEGDPEFVNLSIGEPDYGPPPYAWPGIKAALAEGPVAQALKKYEKSRGSIELRTAIMRYYTRYYGLRYDPETEIMITHGGAGALNVGLLATTKETDEVLVPDPSYMLYEGLIRILGRKPVRIARDPAAGWSYDLDTLRACITDRTKVLLINSPENPSGYMCSPRELDSLVSFAADHGIWLIHDEVYDQTAYGEKHRPASACSPDAAHVILVNSFSKKFAVPGLRIGWLAGAPKVITAASKAQDYGFMAVNKISETIGELLLSHAAMDDWFTQTRGELIFRMDAACRLLGQVPGIRFVRRPEGGLFLFPDVRELGMMLLRSNIGSQNAAGDLVAAALRDELKIATVPGSVYGPNCKDHIRLVFCVDPTLIVEACDRLQNRVRSSTEKTRAYANA